jgi:hypothetical protein
MMQRLQGWFFFIFVVFSFTLGGCATSPFQADAKNRSDGLLSQQLATAKGASSNAPRLWFAGFGLHSGSTAFKLDVAGFATLAKKIDPNVGSVLLTNPAPSQPVDWPYATPDNIETVLKELGASMKSSDVAVVLLTTHGNVNLLAFNANNVEYSPIYAASLRQWFTPLNANRVIVIVSACYSGSLINALTGPNRIVLTAAARDRVSFGCQPSSTNTFFVEELLKAMGDTSKSLEAAFESTKVGVARKETAMKLSPPSLPQISIPPSQTAFSKKPMSEWLIQ